MSQADIKVCPECGVEYYAHIANCADCGIPLRFPEEIQGNARKTYAADEWVEIRQDAQGWVRELSEMLSGHGVPSRVKLADGCKPGGCGSQYRLLVPRDAAHDALAMINDYFVEMHPEAGQSDEWALEGKCPACGHPVDADATECPDCGLALASEEEDCDGSAGRNCR
ncbi:MAG: zinc ribbon domain-containing protein [Nitrospirota bacterium]|nr:zinc ribbon domain-containing protein [Nitrospirota bacterium]